MLKIKLGASTFMWITYFTFVEIFKPILQNEITANKLSNTDESFMEQLYFDNFFTGLFWLLVVVTILMHLSSVKCLIKKYKGGKK